MAATAARVGKDAAGGVNLGGGQAFVRIDGAFWVVVGDSNAGHGPAPHVPGPDAMAAGSAVVRINGVAPCRAGDPAGCGHAISGSGPVRAD